MSMLMLNNNNTEILNVDALNNNLLVDDHIKNLECGLLSKLFRQADLIDKITLQYNKFCFFDHQIIFDAIKQIVNNQDNIKLDNLIVGSYLKLNNRLDQAGGYENINEIYNYAPEYGDVDYYFTLLNQIVLKKKFVFYLKNLLSGSISSDSIFTIQKAVEKFSNRLLSWQGPIIPPFSKLLNDFWSDFKFEASLSSIERTKLRYIKTGFDVIDNHINGIECSKLTIIAAKAGVGKTTLALNILANHISADNTALLVSFEQSAKYIIKKIIAICSGVKINHFNNYNLTSSQWIDTKNTIDYMAKKNLYILENQPDLDQLIMAAHQLKIKDPYFNLLIVDYLSLIPINSFNEHESQKINHIAIKLKKLANQLNIAVIAISGVKKSIQTKFPRLDDCQYLSSHHGDLFIMLSAGDNNFGIDQKLLFTIPKNKEGPLLEGHLWFNKETQKIFSN